MADYCSSSDIHADIPEGGFSATTDYDDAIAQMCTDASRLIDNEVGRWPNYFKPSTDDETRYYTKDDDMCPEELPIDEFAAITSVAVSESGGLASSDYTLWSSSDYYVHPYNYVALGVPIRRLVIDLINGSQNTWFGYRNGVKVVGKPGYSITPPEPINRAARIQVTRWFMRGKQAYADSGAGLQVGQLTYVKKLDPDVAELLKPYIVANL